MARKKRTTRKKTIATFGRDDLPLVAKVADMAHTWIFTQNQNDNSRSEGENPDKRDRRAGSRR